MAFPKQDVINSGAAGDSLLDIFGDGSCKALFTMETDMSAYEGSLTGVGWSFDAASYTQSSDIPSGLPSIGGLTTAGKKSFAFTLTSNYPSISPNTQLAAFLDTAEKGTTVSYWIKRNSSSIASGQRIYSPHWTFNYRNQGSYFGSYASCLTNCGRVPTNSIWRNDQNYDTGANGMGTWNTGQWYHIILSSGNSRGKIYQNGTKVWDYDQSNYLTYMLVNSRAGWHANTTSSSEANVMFTTMLRYFDFGGRSITDAEATILYQERTYE